MYSGSALKNPIFALNFSSISFRSRRTCCSIFSACLFSTRTRKIYLNFELTVILNRWTFDMRNAILKIINASNSTLLVQNTQLSNMRARRAFLSLRRAEKCRTGKC